MVVLVSGLLVTPLVAAAPQVVLVASSSENFTARGLTVLGVEHQRLSPREFGDFAAFDADVLIWGFDESRQSLAERRDELAAFLRAGGVFLGFRCSEDESWLPAAAARDKAYELGEILQAEHPVFNRPHAFSLERLRAIHGGSVYRAFRDLAPGWVPLCSTGGEQSWDKTPPSGAGPRYGLIELPLDAGRLILCQMIPEYAWFHDAKEDRASPGAELFENLVRYALSQAKCQAAGRPPRTRPESFYADLADVLETPGRQSGISLAESAWQYKSSGPYTRKVDRRGVLTFTHADQPSVAGSFAQLGRSLAVPAEARSLVLRWYETDTYCGGREIQLGGQEHGRLALENYQRQMRYAQVLVNGDTVWENDVCGRNPQPARRAVHYADVTELVRKTGRCDVVLRVEDRQGSGAQPFAIDVFFAAVELLGDLRLQAAAGLQCQGFADADGQSLRLAAEKGVLETKHTGSDGRYALAVRLSDGFEGRSKLRVLAAGKALGDWTLSMDDGAAWWAVTPVAELRSGDALRVEIEREGRESPRVEQLALISPRLLAKPRTETALAESRGTTAKQVRFTVTVPETGGLARTAEVAAAGLPFPRGCLTQHTNLRVLDSAGQPVPSQFRPVGRWSDGSARTAVVAFPATVAAGGKACYTVEAGEGIRPGPAGELKIVEEPGRIRIDTGPIQAILSTQQGRVVDELRRGVAVVKPADLVWELAVETEDGRLLRSGGVSVSATRIVERGPLRALIVRTGSLADGAGKQLDYRLTVEATAGSDLLRVETTIVNREDQPEVYIKRWSLDLPAAGAEAGRVEMAGPWRTANAGAVLYQHREDQLTWSGTDGPQTRANDRASGWVRLPGLAVGPRWFWERFPQAIRFTPGAVRFDLLPEAWDGDDLPTRWRDRMREATDRYAVGGVGYPQSPGKMGLFRLARGEALSQEFGLAADGAASDAPAGRPRLAAPLRPVADPAYTASTGAFGPLVPRDPQRLAGYEPLVERCYEGYLAQRQKRREYGFENFGDSTFEWGYGPSYTYWSNSEYDHHYGFALEYLRSGDPRWWELCETTSRHYRDVVVVHHASAESGMRGGPHHHNATSVWMPQHEDQFWIADHTLAGCHVGHSWVEGLIAYAWLSGDPWAEEVVAEMADWYVTVVQRNQFGAGGQERGPGWTLIAISALAEATGDERIFQAGAKVADWLLEWQDPIRGVVSVPISEQPSYEGGSTFMHGIVGRGLGRWYDVTGQTQVKDAAVGIAEWITTEPMSEPGMFWYKQSPQNSKRYAATDQVLTALTYAYQLTGDRWFADVGLALVDKTGPNVRSMSWYGQSLSQLWPLLSEGAKP